MTETFDNSPADVDFIFNEGDDEDFNITREKDDGTAIDISNWTFWLTIKKDPETADSNAAVQKEVTNHTSPSNGQTQISLTSSDTDGLQGRYEYDMQYTTDAGRVKTFMDGQMYFGADVTEST